MADIITILIFTFILLPVIFCVLFIVFLVRSVKLGKRVKELERELISVKYGNPDPAKMMPQQAYTPQQPAQQLQTNIPQPVPQVQPFVPQQAVVPQVQTYMPQQPVPQIQPQAYVPQMAAEQQVQTDNSIATATPSWAVPPAQVQQQRASAPAVAETSAPKKKKVFSSINITFGIGVLLLTIVGATFMTVSWSWMNDALRALSLVAIVVIAYGLSFLAGKILKLQQTGFAFYTLASMLGPIVVLGLGAFDLLGSAFSFKEGTGWLVATLAAAVLLVSSIGGRLLFREKVQTNIYQCTFYNALTWLVVFISAQIGQFSETTTEWNMICLGLATLALVFRILGITKIFKDEKFFNVYSEIITYVPAGLLLIGLINSDGAVFGASIIATIVFMLHARFTEGREWLKYLTPFVAMEIVSSWVIFAGTDEVYLVTAIVAVIILIVYVVHKFLKLSTILSDIFLPAILCTIAGFISYEQAPAAGAAASFLALALVIYPIVIEPLIAKLDSAPEGFFNKDVSLPLQISMSLLGVCVYFTAVNLTYLAVRKDTLNSDLYLFCILTMIPSIIAIVTRFVWKDDVRIKTSGLGLAVLSVICGYVSCFDHREAIDAIPELAYQIHICSWTFTLALITLSLNFIVKPLRERKVSINAMFWGSFGINALSAGTLISVINTTEKISESATTTAMQIITLSFLILNLAAIALTMLMRRKKTELLSGYGTGLKYFFNGFAAVWFFVFALAIHDLWKLIIASVICAALLYILDSGYFAVLPVVTGEIAVICKLGEMTNGDLRNVICIAVTLAVALAGRLIFWKRVVTSKNIDYLTIMAPLVLFGLTKGDYVTMMVLLASGLLVMNYAGRVNVPLKIFVSVFALLVSTAVIFQPFFDIPDLIVLEIDIAILLGTLFAICRFIRPFPENVMKYIWFTGVALSLVAEGVSAAVTSEGLDLIIVGTASIGIFIYAFIRRNRLWFVLGIVSILSIAIYLSVAFWSSLIWLVFLFIAGSVLVAMAAINEWGKRHSKDGKKRRFFEEWTW